MLVVVDVDGWQVKPVGQMVEVGTVVVAVDVEVEDEDEVEDGLHVCPAGQIVVVVDDMMLVVGIVVDEVTVLVVVDVDGWQVKPVGHMVVVV